MWQCAVCKSGVINTNARRATAKSQRLYRKEKFLRICGEMNEESKPRRGIKRPLAEEKQSAKRAKSDSETEPEEQDEESRSKSSTRVRMENETDSE
ncbi:hypothetical protein Ciccas_001046 [Cichlidogyrus casuarinus]|uniref:Uncharacterized protein n=1 Tax=Cichlidogyrus casuarinus TaxID=1844966 RepID=A0ABD2QL83_9PLAT